MGRHNRSLSYQFSPRKCEFCEFDAWLHSGGLQYLKAKGKRGLRRYGNDLVRIQEGLEAEAEEKEEGEAKKDEKEAPKDAKDEKDSGAKGGAGDKPKDDAPSEAPTEAPTANTEISIGPADPGAGAVPTKVPPKSSGLSTRNKTALGILVGGGILGAGAGAAYALNKRSKNKKAKKDEKGKGIDKKKDSVKRKKDELKKSSSTKPPAVLHSTKRPVVVEAKYGSARPKLQSSRHHHHHHDDDKHGHRSRHH